MKFKVVTAIQTEPVSLDEARLHLRIDADNTSEDDLISALIVTAREVAEQYTGRALAPQTLEAALDEFPNLRSRQWTHRRQTLARCDEIELPRPPVTAVASIKYTDLDGTEQTVDPTWYSLSTYGDSREITLAYGRFWPFTQPIADAVRIRFAAGYGADGGPALPKAVKAAILLLVGHLYENRQDVIADVRAVAVQIPMGAEALLDTVKLWGF